MNVSRFRNVVKINEIPAQHGIAVVSLHAGDAIVGPFVIHCATRDRVDADDDVPLVIDVAERMEIDHPCVMHFVRTSWRGRELWATTSAADDIARGKTA
jgi:hypothetical protein